jgi:hypothetical protein
VDPWWRGQRARRRAHRSLASGRSGVRKLAGGGATERGKCGELGSGLTGARVALRRSGDGSVEQEGGGARFEGCSGGERGKEERGEVR